MSYTKVKPKKLDKFIDKWAREMLDEIWVILPHTESYWYPRLKTLVRQILTDFFNSFGERERNDGVVEIKLSGEDVSFLVISYFDSSLSCDWGSCDD